MVTKLKKSASIDIQSVARILAETPDQLRAAQRHLDTVRSEFESYVAGLQIDALVAAVIPGKTVEDPKRAPANEVERKYAVEFVFHRECEAEPKLRELKDEYESAQREVTLCRERLEAYKLIARLLISQTN